MDYAYSARDSLGHMHGGLRQANSREEALQSLRRDGLQVLSLEEDEAGMALFPRRISKAEIIYTTTQLAIMVDTGISLAQAIGGLQEQEENPSLQRLLSELRNEVEAGEDFSAALAKHPKHFDRTFVALVRSAERTGTMGTMLEQLANYMRKQLEYRGKVRAAMAYPAIMLLLATGVTIFLLTFALPKFTPIFSRRGVELPAITSFVMYISDLLINYWYAWGGLLAAILAGYFYARRTDAGRRFFDAVRVHSPVIGPLFRKIIISRSILTLGTMLKSGVAVLEALRLTAEVSDNYYYEQAWRNTIDEVTNGRRICESLKGNPLFPRTLVQMIGSGEETGRLDHVLTKVSVYYDSEVETTLKTTTTLIEPILISVMGVVVGTIAMSLLLPIFTLSRSH